MNKITVPIHNLELLRYSTQKHSTLGALSLITSYGKHFLCHVLEDSFHFDKIAGETRIPAGLYKLGLRNSGGVNDQYKQRYKDKHHGMIEIQGVPNYEYILIHCGNTSAHTKGCLVVGNTSEQNITKSGYVGNSRDAYERIYPTIVKGLTTESYIKIIDWDDLPQDV